MSDWFRVGARASEEQQHRRHRQQQQQSHHHHHYHQPPANEASHSFGDGSASSLSGRKREKQNYWWRSHSQEIEQQVQSGQQLADCPLISPANSSVSSLSSSGTSLCTAHYLREGDGRFSCGLPLSNVSVSGRQTGSLQRSRNRHCPTFDQQLYSDTPSNSAHPHPFADHCPLTRAPPSASLYRSSTLVGQPPFPGSHRMALKLACRSGGWPLESRTPPSSYAPTDRCLVPECGAAEISECSCSASLECLALSAATNSPLANQQQQRNRLYMSQTANATSNVAPDKLRGQPIAPSFAPNAFSHLPIQASNKQPISRTTNSPPPPPPPPPQLIRQNTYTATSDTITDSMMLNEHSDRFNPTTNKQQQQQVANGNSSNNNSKNSKRQSTVSFQRAASTTAEQQADDNFNNNNNISSNKATSLQRLRSAPTQVEESRNLKQLAQAANSAIRSQPGQQHQHQHQSQQQQQLRQQHRAATHTCPSSPSRLPTAGTTDALKNAPGSSDQGGFQNRPTGAIYPPAPLPVNQQQQQHPQLPTAVHSVQRPPSRHLLSSAPFDGPLSPLPPVAPHRTNSPWMRISSIVLTPIGIIIILFIVVSPLIHYLN